jgi:Zn-dependent protease
MLGWSTNLFRIRGIRLQLHFTFFVLLAAVAFEGWSEAGWTGALWNTGTLLLFFACIVLHELGHCFTAMHYGIRVSRILLTPIGGMAEFEKIPRQPVREILMTLAGPAVNFALFGLLCLVPEFPEIETASPYSLAGLVDLLCWFNLFMGCFNLFLPIFPMDGGRILRALLALRLPYVRATFWAAMTGKILATIGIFAALTAQWTGLNIVAAPWFGENEGPRWMNAILFAFIFFVGEVEYRVVRRRELEEAHWRDYLARQQALQRARVAEASPPLML